jgi:hypothetical protein
MSPTRTFPHCAQQPAVGDQRGDQHRGDRHQPEPGAQTRLPGAADEKGVNSIHTPGGMQEMTVINEPGLYSLVLGSRKPEVVFCHGVGYDTPAGA